MTLQLADQTIHHTMGIIEDILVKVDRFIFLLHFVILDLDDKVEAFDPRAAILGDITSINLCQG